MSERESPREFLRQEVTEPRWMLYLYRAVALLMVFTGLYDLVGWVG